MSNKRHLEIARKITQLLELEFSIWKFKFGFDPILGVVPGLGDFLTTGLSLYLVFVAIIHKIPFIKILQMIFYIVIDFLIGLIPLLGDILDFVIRPNVKNLSILESEIKKK